MLKRLQTLIKTAFSGVRILPLTIPLLLIAIIFATRAIFGGEATTDGNGLFGRYTMEPIALILIFGVVAVFGFRMLSEPDNPLMKLAFTFSFVFFCREIHFAGTTDGVYVGAFLVAAWAWFWRKRLAKPFGRGQFKTWLFAAGWAYFLALFIQRRAMKHLIPASFEELRALEHATHIAFEESMENLAHALLLVTAFSGKRKWKSGANDAGTGE